MTHLRRLFSIATLALLTSWTAAEAQQSTKRLPPPPGIPGITTPPTPQSPNSAECQYSGPQAYWLMVANLPGLTDSMKCQLANQLWLEFLIRTAILSAKI